ncbi:MAG: response regulator [Chloroflexota bacterium]
MNIKAIALVVEDHPGQAVVFRTALQQVGFDAMIAPDGDDASEKLERSTPQLVLLDLHLPGVSGEEILKRIRNNERFDRTRVVIASADVELANSLEAEADEIIIKPINFNDLKTLIQELKEE